MEVRKKLYFVKKSIDVTLSRLKDGILAMNHSVASGSRVM